MMHILSRHRRRRTNPHQLLLFLTVCLIKNHFLVNGLPTLSSSLVETNDDGGGGEDLIWELKENEPIANSEPNHKIISKSVSAKNIAGGIADNLPVQIMQSPSAAEASLSTVQHQYVGNKDKRADDADVAGSVSKESKKGKRSYKNKRKSAPDSLEVEDQILQDMIARRRDAIKFRIRNSSELLLGNQKEQTVKTNGKNNSAKNAPKTDAMPKIVFLQKPFHFHIPIVSVADKPVQNKDKGVRKRSQNKANADDHRRHAHRQGSPGLVGSSSVAGKRKTAKRDSRPGQPQRQESAETPDTDRLIDQFPELIPSINRKRQSRNDRSGSRLRVLEDESHYHSSLVNAPASEAKATPKSKLVVQGKRNVKNVKFSQDVVNSILGHDDDFRMYRSKINSQAERLGVKPEDIFRAVVYGPAQSNLTGTTTIENHDIHQRRQQFQKLFLGSIDESEGKQNPIAADPSIPNDGSSLSKYDETRYNAYMKIIQRNKRGLGNWLKNIFHRDGRTAAKPTTTTTTTTTVRPRRKMKTRKRPSPKQIHHKNVYKADVDSNGDTEVDMLLPKALRRSTYLKNRNNINSRIEEEEEIEEEYEKSEEMEQKRREGYKGSRKRRSVLVTEQGSGQDAELRLRKIYVLSKDEILLINEMILNVMQYQCVAMDDTDTVETRTLENLRTITEKVMETSGLPSSVDEERLPLEDLFSQLLACTEWLCDSDEGPPRSRNKGLAETISSPLLRPLHRTKRIRSTVRKIGESTDQPPRATLIKLDDDKAESIFLNYVRGFLKLHFLFYKVTLDACQQFLDKKLLHDVILHLLKEFFRLPGAPLPRREELYQSFQKYPIEITTAEKVFNNCYFASFRTMRNESLA